MEENIKVLEQLVEEHKKLGDISEETRISQPLFKIIIQAIENLIARNKELEEENMGYYYHVQGLEDDMKMHYIPKSKVEEEFERMIAHSNCFNVGDINDLLDRILN